MSTLRIGTTQRLRLLGLNTTSRLEQVARELGRRLVVSADAIGRLAGAEPYPLEGLGARPLRGRSSPVQVYGVTGPVRPP